MSIVDFSFGPRSVTVAAGGSVTWVWGGTEEHNTTGSFWQSPLQATGSFTVTFDTPGSYDYRCTIHSLGVTKMAGTVVVQ